MAEESVAERELRLINERDAVSAQRIDPARIESQASSANAEMRDDGRGGGGDWGQPAAQDPGEAGGGGSWASAYVGAPVASPQQDAPAQPSPYTDRSAIGQHAARQGISFNDAADELGRVNASPGAGYRQTGPGQFEPIQGGPADPRMQPQPQGPQRMMQTGQGSGQMMPDTPENRLRDLNHTIQRVQLSQPEQMRAQALQQSMAGVDEAMHRGDLTPEDAGRLRQQIQAQGEQLWARQGSLPEMMMKQQFLQQQHAIAQQTALENENATSRAQRVADHTHTFEDGTRVYTDPQGRTHIIPPHEPRPDAAAAHANAQQQKAWEAHEKLVERLHNEVRRDLQEARRSPRAGELADDTTSRRNPEWIQRLRQQGEGELTPEVIEARALRYRLNQHYGALHTQEPTQPGTPAGGGGPGAPGGAPGGQPAAAQQSFGPLRNTSADNHSPAQRQARQGFENFGHEIAQSHAAPGVVANMAQANSEAFDMLHRFGSPDRMTGAQRAEYQRHLAVIWAGLHPSPVAPPQATPQAGA